MRRRLLLNAALMLPAVVTSAVPAAATASTGGDAHLLEELWVDAGGPYQVDAGASTTLDASRSRLESCTRAEFAWDLDGDGLVETTVSSSPTVTFSATHMDGPLELEVHVQVTCWLIDEIASIDGSDDARVTVRNADPEISGVERDANPREGTPVTMTVEFVDPEGADTHTVQWDLGDGETAVGEEIEHRWVQDGRYEVTVVVTDDDGGLDTFVAVADVANLPPTLSGSPQTQVAPDEAYAFTPLVIDPGLADTHSFTASLPPAATLDPLTGQVAWTPTLDDLGDWDLSLSVQDDAGDGDTMLWTLTVSEDAPTDTGTELGDRPWADGHAQADPWQDAYPITGEGCRCTSNGRAAEGRTLTPLAALSLVALIWRRRRPRS